MSRPDLDLPLGKRTRKYRFFEMCPAILSYGMVILLVVLSIVNPLLASAYLLVIVLTTLVKAIGVAYRTIYGYRQLVKAENTNWAGRLSDLCRVQAGEVVQVGHEGFDWGGHAKNLRLISEGELIAPSPSDIYHAVIVAAYNESYEVLKPTFESVKNSSFDNKRLVVFLAYEERGGPEIERTAKKIQREYAGAFCDIQIVRHPKDLPEEVQGKGPNITYAGYRVQQWCDDHKVDYEQVIVTTLDSDNRPHREYFDSVAYEFVVSPNRQKLSYQPIALYFGNIWDAPAPMRVLATGNSFWTVIGSMRPHTLRNFAAHSQPLKALVDMDFWSRRSIVEDGHQYWRSYFHFNGDYSVLPIHLPVYQDAVMSNTLKETLISQFKQLRRWAYGASDIPYVAVRLFTKSRQAPFWGTMARFVRLVDSHVTWAAMAVLVAFGAWIPLLINPEASRNIASHSLPLVVSRLQQVAMIGVFVTIMLMLKMLPPRPERYKKTRTIMMVLQWVLMPVTSICYSSAAAFTAQTHLFLGKYLDKFDVTDKATVDSRDKAKKRKNEKKRQRRRKGIFFKRAI